MAQDHPAGRVASRRVIPGVIHEASASVTMVWPAWLWIGTRLKFSLWLANRLATWTGVGYLWRRLRSRRWFWLWMVLANLLSLGALAAVFFWLHRSSVE